MKYQNNGFNKKKSNGNDGSHGCSNFRQGTGKNLNNDLKLYNCYKRSNRHELNKCPAFG